MKIPTGSLAMLLVGAALGWGGANLSSSAPTVVVSSPEVARTEAAPVARCVASLDATQLAALRAELAQGAPAAPAPQVVAPAAAAEPSAASLAAEDEAEQRVEDAISRGSWTEQDRTALRGAMSQLTNAQTEGVMSKLVLALNEGRLRLDRPGPLF